MGRFLLWWAAVPAEEGVGAVSALLAWAGSAGTEPALPGGALAGAALRAEERRGRAWGLRAGALPPSGTHSCLHQPSHSSPLRAADVYAQGRLVAFLNYEHQFTANVIVSQTCG